MGIGITNLDKDKRKVFTLTKEVVFLGERNDDTGILKGRSETKTLRTNVVDVLATLKDHQQN